jgi:hypothetical protein
MPCTACLHFGSQQGPLCLLNRRVKPKTLVNEQDIVVNALGHTNNVAQHVSLLALLLDCIRACIATVAANLQRHR